MKRAMFTLLSLALVTAPGCAGELDGGADDRGPGNEEPTPVPPVLTLGPSEVTLRVRDGVAVDQVYTATLTTGAGEVVDVSDRVRLTLTDSAFGRFDGPTLSVTGAAAGETSIRASVDGAAATASLRVEVTSHRVSPSAPADASTLFTGTEDAAAAPTLVYPAA